MKKPNIGKEGWIIIGLFLITVLVRILFKNEGVFHWDSLKDVMVIEQMLKTGEIQYSYNDSKKIPKCENKEELIKILRNINALESDEGFLRTHIHFPPEGIANKIARIINENINPRKV